MADDTPLLDTLALMTAASLETCELDPRELMLARIAVLAMRAPRISSASVANTLATKPRPPSSTPKARP